MTVNPCYPRGRGAGWSPFSPLPLAGALRWLRGARTPFRGGGGGLPTICKVASAAFVPAGFWSVCFRRHGVGPNGLERTASGFRAWRRRLRGGGRRRIAVRGHGSGRVP